MRNRSVSSKHSESSKEPVLKSFSEGSNSVDIPAPHRAPLPVYDKTSTSLAQDTKVITIGSGVVFSGKVIEADNVKLEGKADGEIIANTVELSSAGALEGKIKCDTLIVAGTFSGEASVAGSLSLKSTGKIAGKISYGSLNVEFGGAVLGTLEQEEAKCLPATPAEEFVGASSKPG